MNYYTYQCHRFQKLILNHPVPEFDKVVMIPGSKAGSYLFQCFACTPKMEVESLCLQRLVKRI